MRQKVVAFLKDRDAVSVENPAYPGTPDVNYVEGWIELKWEREFPKKADSVFRVEHFSPQQRVWLHRRHRKGGKCWLLLQVGKEWMLFDGMTAFEIVGKVCKQELINKAVWYSKNGLTEEMKNYL